MREKLKTLPLTELKELAKAQGLKGVSTMRKNDIIELLCEKAASAVPLDPEPNQDESQPASQGSTAPVQNRDEAASASRSSSPPIPTRDSAPSVSHSSFTQTSTVDSTASASHNSFSQTSARDSAASASHNSFPQTPTRDNAASASHSSISTPSAREGSVTPSHSGSATPQSHAPQTQATRPGQSAGTGTYRTQNRAVRPYPPSDQGDRRGEKVQPQISEDEMKELDSGIEANGILEVMPDGFGFIRCENFLPGENDVYVAPSQIRRFNMKTGDIIQGNRRIKSATEKFAALLFVKTINGYAPIAAERRPNFEDLTPIFPNERLHMETRTTNSTAMRVLDLLSPIGKGQRGMIVSPPKAGKTTLLKQVAKAITTNHPDMHLIILLIDERPEEVTDIREAIIGPNVEVIYSTFDELPERHKRVSEMVIERAKRLVEHGREVIILLDSITRLARAYNLTVAPSGRTLSGGLDPAALHMPKRFFGAARNMREGGSLTVLATALVDTGSRMDDVVYEEFKGTGNMELVLDRKLSEKRIFPAIDILKSGTRNDHLLLSYQEKEAVDIIRKATNSLKPDDAVEKVLDLFSRTRSNREFVEMAKKIRFF